MPSEVSFRNTMETPEGKQKRVHENNNLLKRNNQTFLFCETIVSLLFQSKIFVTDARPMSFFQLQLVVCLLLIKMPPKKVPKIEKGQQQLGFLVKAVTSVGASREEAETSGQTSCSVADVRDSSTLEERKRKDSKGKPGRCFREEWLKEFHWLR